MKKLIYILAVIILSCASSEVNSQDLPNFMKKRKEAAKRSLLNRTGKEADKAIDKKVNKALDNVFEDDESENSPSDSSSTQSGNPSSSGNSSSEASMRMLMGAMGMSADAANVKPAYNFDGMIKMLVSEYNDGDNKESETEYTTYFDSKSYDYGMEFEQADNNGSSFIIFDTDNSLMITMGDSNGEKTGFAINFTPEQAEAITQEDEEDESDELTETNPYAKYKTGKKKKILGYTCHEYLIDDPNEIVSMWVTDEMDKDIKKSYLKNATFSGLFMYAYYTEGMVMEYIIEDKDDNDKTIMTVTDIDLNKNNSISTSGYRIMNMGNFMEEEVEEDAESDIE